ncbi:hypothetical protein FCV25MIE_02091 [Fagus crenata]
MTPTLGEHLAAESAAEAAASQPIEPAPESESDDSDSGPLTDTFPESDDSDRGTLKDTSPESETTGSNGVGGNEESSADAMIKEA